MVAVVAMGLVVLVEVVLVVEVVGSAVLLVLVGVEVVVEVAVGSIEKVGHCGLQLVLIVCSA